MPSYKLLGIHRNNGFPFSTLCSEHVGAKEGFTAVYVHQGVAYTDFAFLGVVPRKGLVSKLLRRKEWRYGSMPTSFYGQVKGVQEVYDALGAIGFGGGLEDGRCHGIPPLLFI